MSDFSLPISLRMLYSHFTNTEKIHIRHAHTRSNRLHYIYRYTHNDIKLHPHIRHLHSIYIRKYVHVCITRVYIHIYIILFYVVLCVAVPVSQITYCYFCIRAERRTYRDEIANNAPIVIDAN